jgi:hypothetical protein
MASKNVHMTFVAHMLRGAVSDYQTALRIVEGLALRTDEPANDANPTPMAVPRRQRKRGVRRRAPQDPTLREIITAVLRDGAARSTGAIALLVSEQSPATARGSVAGELLRMRKAGLIVARGRGPRGALYAIAIAGPEDSGAGA